MTKRKNRIYVNEFKQKTVVSVTEYSYRVSKTAASLDITQMMSLHICDITT